MKLKKILSAVAVIGMLACTSAFAASGALSLTAEKTTVAPGEEVTVNLNMVTNPGEILFSGQITATTGLTLVSREQGTALSGYSMDNDIKLPYTVYALETNTGVNNTKTGVIASFNFKAQNAGEYTITFTPDEGYYNVDKDYTMITYNTPTLKIKVESASTTSIGAATKGGELEGQKTFYAPITIDTSAQTGARFWVKKGETEKSWEIPSGIVGVANFYAVVKTAETGTYTYNVVSSTGTAIGTAQTATID